ncbi:unnamed protein product [Rotaria socialis]|uniref:Uncharacterized protein n=1 Tax=Rotaria socialis TaxID=392032 RepID=A0A818AMG8_9BILA|nr:unnamed protein product [Rotaria socialis]
MGLLNQYFIIVCSIGCCSAHLHLSNHHCLDGPNLWCLNNKTESICNFTNKTIGICGYSNKRCPVTTEPNGGLTGVDDSLFSYYIRDLY